MTQLIAAVKAADEATQKAQESVLAAKEARRAAVQALADAGLTYRQIAETLGITHGRVAQILKP